ncbi:MAG: transglycosylase domain-containing protein [candidate division KSB1 bacterium]|nr:transglycosylase domain-containing protein [candidate division KSB1 bacterium]MDZ7335155.1 transglycosylase domain-containing protein [candidate division KSB1 bacterium]MDZ7356838.1 transglycosylase domain-containing protein [candidate division KSB1 bacterium]MDZ7376101.1 transglycosylase domain-containing protein [candidate division KSB1 bacterium]MDZ7401323.1 transglycosylase domain-containing protein [candidate division KSB1 bacterium]
MATRKHNIIKWMGLALLVMFMGIGWLIESLPSRSEIENFRPESTVSRLSQFDWSKRAFAPVRKYVPLRQISTELRTAVLISEDDTFFEHSGINLTELKKAFQENLKKKRYARGASTITMQVARNAFLTKKKTLIRKLKEIILAKRIERIWTKQKIFEYYLNIVEWGDNIYGAEAASYFYFDKPASQINMAEATILAGMLPNPIVLNPFKNWPAVKRRQLRVLKLMRNAKLLTDEEYDNLIDTPVYLRGSQPPIPEPIMPDSSLFDQALQDPRIPQELKQQADTTGIIFIPEEQ